MLPRFRERLDDARTKLQEISEQIHYLHLRVVLCEPLEAELEDTRRWVKELG